MRCPEVNWNELVQDRNNGGCRVSSTAQGEFFDMGTVCLERVTYAHCKEVVPFIGLNYKKQLLQALNFGHCRA